jgi:hypothetical protein
MIHLADSLGDNKAESLIQLVASDLRAGVISETCFS